MKTIDKENVKESIRNCQGAQKLSAASTACILLLHTRLSRFKNNAAPGESSRLLLR